MVVAVDTEGCWMEQERVRGDPNTSSVLVADTVTSGLGTEKEKCEYQIVTITLSC